MLESPKRRRGFTLIEAMIVIAIVGLLVAMAIPNFLRFQLRAKSSEAKSNLAAIRSLEIAHFAEFNAFAAAAATPAAPPGSARIAWPAPSPGCANCFDALGFRPEGAVYFQYEVIAAIANAASSGNDVFTAAAVANLDGDGSTQIWGYVRALPNGGGAQPSSLAGGVPAAPCPAAGVWDAASGAAALLDSVGACDARSGKTVF